MINVLPAYTASTGHKAREVVGEAFWEYFQKKGYEDGSILVKNRHQNSTDNKIPLKDIARFEVAGAIGLLVNTAPAAFWMLFYLYSHPQVLQDCRKELDRTIVTSTLADGSVRRFVDITNVKTQCPFLTSIFTETLRERGMALSVRKVMHDAFLDGQYLLKEGRTIMMPARVLHNDPELWGSDVGQFNPNRFQKDKSTKKHDPTAFRGFGGGTTLCPGRHFATTEILSTVLMFVLRYELEPTNGWAIPTTDKTSVAAAVMEPDTDVEVRIHPRMGFEKGEWAFGLKDSEMAFAVAAEDNA